MKNLTILETKHYTNLYEQDLVKLIQVIVEHETLLEESRRRLFNIEGFSPEKCFQICSNSEIEILTKED